MIRREADLLVGIRCFETQCICLHVCVPVLIKYGTFPYVNGGEILPTWAKNCSSTVMVRIQ